MKTKVNKIAKTIAVGIFFMALLFNVKLSLQDPFIKIDNAGFAQTSSSGGGDGVKCYSILQGSQGQSVACSPCILKDGIPPWYHFGDRCNPNP
ncbi:hypothetical protein [Lunatimonas sp.]|uniref:hypothetical protein n=1 Tax=Lunatimonas sp. TaxID=2060141 RepID=UPI00263AB46A|nr:hypothetical protein [Lunatimonas sp.]